MFTVRGEKLAQMRNSGRLPGLGAGATRVQAAMSGFNQRRQAITANVDYTQEAKKRYLAKLDAEQAEYRSMALHELRGDWDGIRRDFARLKDKQAKAAEKAAQAWDYNRLAYEAVRVGQLIQGASGNPIAGVTALGQIHQAYETARNGGDRILQRAWAENGPALVQARVWTNDERVAAADLGRQMQADFEKLTVTPELSAIGDEAAALIARVSDLSTLTDQIKRTFDYTGPFATTSEFDTLADGINLRASYDPQRGNFDNSLEVTE